MFNLTSKKGVFFGISGVVLLAGILALIFWRLNPGIDFTNGATIDLRFSSANVATQDVANAFKAAHAKDVQVFASKDLSGSTPPSQYAYIRFSRPIGTDEAKKVLALLQDPKAQLPPVKTESVHTLNTVELPDAAKTTYGLMVVPFDGPVKSDAIKAALANLPPTDVPPTLDTTTPAATPAPAASPTTTAAPTGTTAPATGAVKPAPTTAPAAAATPAPAATAAPTPTTFPVSVSDVQLGANAQTYTIETQTFLGGAALDKVLFALQQKYGYAFIQSTDEVGPAIASETTFNAILAVALAAVFILVYIGLAFRKVGSMQQSFRFGACAIIALLHDALVVLGLWAIFGKFFDFKVDTLFVTAVLTVIGFSVHDTIVVFDRIRENLSRRTNETFEQVVNASLVQTMSRSLNTSLTVLFTLSALTLFGGASIRTFTLALLIGIASGTYSSIFNASMLLVVWETGEWRDWPIIRRFARPDARAAKYRRSLARAGASAR